MGFTLMKDAVSRALVTRLAPGGMAFRLGVRTGASSELGRSVGPLCLSHVHESQLCHNIGGKWCDVDLR